MKFRITRTTIVEYEVDPSLYDTDDYQEMLKIDLEACKEDPEMFFSHTLEYDECTGRVLEG